MGSARAARARSFDRFWIALTTGFSAGVDPKEISRRAGHASVAFTLDRYGHLLPEVDKQAGAKLELLRKTATVG